MTLAEMKEYLAYCLEGPSSIPERKEILAVKKEALLASMEKLQKAIDYIDWKQGFLMMCCLEKSSITVI